MTGEYFLAWTYTLSNLRNNSFTLFINSAIDASIRLVALYILFSYRNVSVEEMSWLL